jgi:hypothetical protein
VAAFHRQNQVRQLEGTWPIDGLCIYNYQLATQVDRIDNTASSIPRRHICRLGEAYLRIDEYREDSNAVVSQADEAETAQLEKVD